jgi:hypothetical protein
VEPSPLDIGQNVGFGDDPDSYFANFSTYHFDQFANKLWQTDIWQNAASDILAKQYLAK